MAKKIIPLRTNPVVFYADDVAPPGWHYRAADEDALHGPFATREVAVEYALRAMTNPAGATAVRAVQGRRAA